MHEKYQEQQPRGIKVTNLLFAVAVLLPLLFPPQLPRQSLELEEEGNGVEEGRMGRSHQKACPTAQRHSGGKVGRV